MDPIPSPQYVYLTSGKGKGGFPLLAFDRALQNAKAADLNLIQVSSVFPPACQIAYELPTLAKGRMSPVVYSTFSTIEKGQTIASAIALAIPSDPRKSGMFFEESGYGTEEDFRRNVVAMARDAMEDREIEVNIIQITSTQMTCEGEPAAVVSLAIFLWV